MNLKCTIQSVSLILFILAGLIFSGCKGKPEGYGVLLWSEKESELQNGTLLDIISSSQLNNTYTVTSRDSEISMTIPQWRVAFFSSRRDAETKFETYDNFKTLYALNQRDRLPIRERPDSASAQIYRLRSGQIVKIIDKEPVKTQINGYEGHWYRVLTEDGYSGFLFDLYLTVFDSTEETELALDPDISRAYEVLSHTYRPVEFQDMIRENQVDLSIISRDMGLFPDIKENVIKIHKKDASFTMTWESITAVNENIFILNGADMELHIIREGMIQVNYTISGENYSERYIRIPNLETIILNELERREIQKMILVESGGTYSSTAYGTITFEEDGTFLWTDYQRLVPSIIPQTAGNRGTFEFSHFPARELRDRYTGVVTLRFQGLAQSRIFNFLYIVEERAIRLANVPDQHVENRIVLRESQAPLIMVFFAVPPEE